MKTLFSFLFWFCIFPLLIVGLLCLYFAGFRLAFVLGVLLFPSIMFFKS